jgi:hypothetical protein
MSRTVADRIAFTFRIQAHGCARAAIVRGWPGDQRDYVLTRDDMDWIARQVEQELERPATAEEWRAAGRPEMAGLYT